MAAYQYFDSELANGTDTLVEMVRSGQIYTWEDGGLAIPGRESDPDYEERPLEHCYMAFKTKEDYLGWYADIDLDPEDQYDQDSEDRDPFDF